MFTLVTCYQCVYRAVACLAKSQFMILRRVLTFLPRTVAPTADPSFYPVCPLGGGGVIWKRFKRRSEAPIRKLCLFWVV